MRHGTCVLGRAPVWGRLAAAIALTMHDRRLEDIRHDIATLRAMIDRELDEGRNGGLIVRALSRVLQDKLRQLAEFEEQHSFGVRATDVRWSD